MPQLRNWLLLEMGDDIPMKWFQSLDRGDFGVPVSHAWLFHDDYEFDVPAAACRRLPEPRTGPPDGAGHHHDPPGRGPGYG